MAMSPQAVLQELNAIINQAQAVPDMVQNAHRAILAAVSGQAFAIYLNDPRTNELFSWYVVNAPFKDVRFKRTQDNIVGYVGATGRSLRVADVYDAKALQALDAQLHFDPRLDQQFGFKTTQSLTVPILHGNSSMGVLQILNRSQPTPFSPDDEKLLVEIGKMIGTGFYNIRVRAALGAQGQAAPPPQQPQAQPPPQQQASHAQAAPAAKGKGKFAMLVDKGAIKPDKLEQALQEAPKQKLDPAVYLVQNLGLSRKDVGACLSAYYQVPFFEYDGTQRISEEVKRMIKPDFLQRYKCAPLKKEGGNLVLIVDDPHDVGRIDMLRSTGTSATVSVLVGLQDDIMALIDASYSGPQESMKDILANAADEDLAVDDNASAQAGGEVGESDSAVVKLVNQIMREAYERGVSDIHIEPNGHENPVAVRFRKDGDCYLHQELPPAFRRAVTARIKILAKLDIAERRKPQDGKIRFMLNNKKVELRVATIPTTEDNEDVVMRILAASKPLPLEKMGFSAYNLENFKKILDMPYGLVLVVGPTGSGKTTTLHSGMGFINTPDRKIWTAEDPVEITQRGLRQVQVMPKIDFTFAVAMKAFLRADPDVIMVGEMRDQETAETGIEASLTGHLVLSTLHTNSAPETITRLLDMELDPFSFADALLGVLAQRLLRTLCGQCKEAYTPEQSELQEMRRAFDHEERFAQLMQSKPQLFRAKGCPACGNSGYKGRMGVHELMIASDGIKAQIQKRARVAEIREAAIQGGMWTLLQDGVAKVFAGHTDFRQVAAVCIK
ncbi:MAG: Flp pilus assembly complex ATPase component TadA [Deltaproteobacteria bacterium]|nr:Flp pilus assembly complex ATPase component TadA [Deltaproteobacteria bacterium]